MLGFFKKTEKNGKKYEKNDPTPSFWKHLFPQKIPPSFNAEPALKIEDTQILEKKGKKVIPPEKSMLVFFKIGSLDRDLV